MYKWLRLRVYIVKVAWGWLSDPRLPILTEILNYCIYHVLVVYYDGDDYIYKKNQMIWIQRCPLPQWTITFHSTDPPFSHTLNYTILVYIITSKQYTSQTLVIPRWFLQADINSSTSMLDFNQYIINLHLLCHTIIG